MMAIEKDAESFDRVLAAYRLPADTDADRPIRAEAIQQATKEAATIPLETATAACAVLELLAEIADIGNPNALSDVAVGAQMAMAAVKGASYNVLINLTSITDEEFNNEHRRRVVELTTRAAALAGQIENAFRSHCAWA
jgi:formiminotetrahydrofolate cyclodeaminase